MPKGGVSLPRIPDGVYHDGYFELHYLAPISIYTMELEPHTAGPLESLKELQAQGHEYIQRLARNLFRLVAEQVDFSPVVGVSESAVLLGVSKQRVDQLKTHELMPAPAQILTQGPIWRTTDILTFALERPSKARS